MTIRGPPERDGPVYRDIPAALPGDGSGASGGARRAACQNRDRGNGGGAGRRSDRRRTSTRSPRQPAAVRQWPSSCGRLPVTRTLNAAVELTTGCRAGLRRSHRAHRQRPAAHVQRAVGWTNRLATRWSRTTACCPAPRVDPSANNPAMVRVGWLHAGGRSRGEHDPCCARASCHRSSTSGSPSPVRHAVRTRWWRGAKESRS